MTVKSPTDIHRAFTVMRYRRTSKVERGCHEGKRKVSQPRIRQWRLLVATDELIKRCVFGDISETRGKSLRQSHRRLLRFISYGSLSHCRDVQCVKSAFHRREISSTSTTYLSKKEKIIVEYFVLKRRNFLWR